MNTDFYKTIKTIDEIRDLNNPTDSQIEMVLNLITEEKFARYFFLDLRNPYWVIPVYKRDFFHRIPEPIEVQSGSFQLPDWPAGAYLLHFADQYENIVADVVQASTTENWRAQEILTDMLLKISPAKAADLVPVIETWLSGRFSGMLPNKLVLLADHFIQAGFIGAAIRLLEYVITPVVPSTASESSKYFSNVRFRSEDYWVKEYHQNQFSKLVLLDPAGVTLAFEHQVERVIALVGQGNQDDAELQVGYYWRLDIPTYPEENHYPTALEILIDGLRDGLGELCKQSEELGRAYLQSYLSSPHVIFQRIALFTLRKWGNKYRDLVNRAFLERNYLEKAEFVAEYRGLMRDQFADSPDDVKSQVITWILAGPQDVESRAANRARWENRDPNDDDRRLVREHWMLTNLEIIGEYLSKVGLERLNELIALHGKPNIREGPRFETSSVHGVQSPISAEDMARKSFDELKLLFLTDVSEDSFFHPREGLAQTFQSLVREDPNKYSEFAAYLVDPAIRFVYIDNYLSGVREALRGKNGVLGDKILDLCDYVISLKDDPFKDSVESGEAGLLAVQMEVGSLLEEALRSDNPYLTRGQLDRIRSFLILLAHHFDPTEEDNANNGFDPFTRSLNCVRGEAMHGIVQYSLYVVRQDEKLKNEKLTSGYLDPQIQEILEEKLDLEIEPSLAVHSVFGAYIPQLHYLSRGWLEAHLPEIFPEGDEKTAFWKAAWDAYIFASNVYHDVFHLLIPQYQRGIRLSNQSQDESKKALSSPNERLAQHLMFAYLKGWTDFDHENLLLDLFYSHAPDGIRAQGVFWLSKVLAEQEPKADDDLWQRCWQLWQKRLNTAETQDISINAQEISDYVRWLANCPLALDTLYPTLDLTIKYLNDGYDYRLLTSFVAKHCEEFPLEAATLLKRILLLAKEPWRGPEEKDEEKILRSALASGLDDARRIALEIINYRGEGGDFRWKILIE